LGGHSEAFLERYPMMILVGIDRDKNALRLAGQRLERFGGRVQRALARGAPGNGNPLRARPHPVLQCAAVFDGGTLAPDRRGSTVVDLSARGAFSIVREGSARERVVATASQFGLAERPLS